MYKNTSELARPKSLDPRFSADFELMVMILLDSEMVLPVLLKNVLAEDLLSLPVANDKHKTNHSTNGSKHVSDISPLTKGEE